MSQNSEPKTTQTTHPSPPQSDASCPMKEHEHFMRDFGPDAPKSDGSSIFVPSIRTDALPLTGKGLRCVALVPRANSAPEATQSEQDWPISSPAVTGYGGDPNPGAQPGFTEADLQRHAMNDMHGTLKGESARGAKGRADKALLRDIKVQS